MVSHWSQVKFSDEKRFALFNDGPVRVWRRREDRYRQGFRRQAVKYSVSVMMWLCIDSRGRSRLCRCAHRQDSAAYQEILSSNLDFLRHRGGAQRAAQPIVFQQDGAPSHTSRSTQAFLAAHRVQVLPDWPANSPDLNLVENCWAWIARQLVGQSFGSEDALEKAIRDAWESRPATLIPNLYNSMVRRLTAVLAARGDATRY